MGDEMKTKLKWLKMEDSAKPSTSELPFTLECDGKQYEITRADFVDRVWGGEEIHAS